MKLLKNEKRRFMQTLAFAGQYLIKLIVMFLLMTMNVYVALVIALGVSLGYAFVPRIISKMTKKQSYSNQ